MPKAFPETHYSLELRRAPIEYTMLDPYEPDPDWTFTDSHGHTHDASRETLEWVVTDRYWCDDCRDWHEEGEYRCRICGEVITPGRRYVGHGPHYLPGLMEGTLRVGEATYVLRPDELHALPKSGEATEEWLAKVQARPADEVAEEVR